MLKEEEQPLLSAAKNSLVPELVQMSGCKVTDSQALVAIHLTTEQDVCVCMQFNMVFIMCLNIPLPTVTLIKRTQELILTDNTHYPPCSRGTVTVTSQQKTNEYEFSEQETLTDVNMTAMTA